MSIAATDAALWDTDGVARRLEDVYDELAPAVTGYFRGRGSTDPDAACGDVFVRVAGALGSFRGSDAALRRWVFTIAHHRLVDELKSARRGREIVTGTVPETGRTPSDESSDESIDPSLVAALGALGDEQREVVVLRYVADLSVRDVAEILGKSSGAVKMLQARGLDALRARLADDDA